MLFVSNIQTRYTSLTHTVWFYHMAAIEMCLFQLTQYTGILTGIETRDKIVRAARLTQPKRCVILSNPAIKLLNTNVSHSFHYSLPRSLLFRKQQARQVSVGHTNYLVYCVGDIFRSLRTNDTVSIQMPNWQCSNL